jgi:prepilin-type N-terminal cleavage/methylation domain-containing protein
MAISAIDERSAIALSFVSLAKERATSAGTVGSAVAAISDVNARGFTLIETMIAISITAVALTALAQLFVIAAQADADARRATFASILASQKIEQLKSLGADLVAQGAAALSEDIAGACDFLDEYGRSLGTASSPLPGTVYIRRWSIEPIASDPDTFVLQVAVFPRLWRSAVDPSGPDARPFGGAQVVTVKRRSLG